MTSLQRVILCLAVLLVGSAGPAISQDQTDGAITLSGAWSRATPPAARNGALYLTIRNNGAAPDRLIAIATDAAASAELHEMTMDNGVMRMRALSEGLTVAPGATVALAPGGLHSMLIGLKNRLQTGDNFTATAIFEIAGRIEFTVPVMTMGARAPHGSGMEMHHGGTKP